MSRSSGWLASLLLVAACAAHEGGTRPRTLPQQVENAPVGTAEGALPRLAVVVGTQTSDGRVMKLRGSIRNPLGETVRGVRLRLRLRSRAGGDAEVLETQRKDLDAVLEPGGTVPLHWEVESMYLGAAGGGFELEALPKRVGERDVAAPPGW